MRTLSFLDSVQYLINPMYARYSCGGGMPGPEGMPRILGSVQTGPLGQLLHHARHIDTEQPTCLYVPIPIDGTERRVELTH
jgi:hypothetical protein